MKTGDEIHYIAGQLFSMGVAAVVVVPRMPTDSIGTPRGDGSLIGGRLTYSFRRALLLLVTVGLTRLICCHILHDSNHLGGFMIALDVCMGTIHVVGQTFLCLSTAYILRCQLATVINLPHRPGRTLMPYLVSISILAIVGAVGTAVLYVPQLWCLVSLSEALSCAAVLSSLKLYTSVTAQSLTPARTGCCWFRGPLLTQMLSMTEVWYGIMSLLALFAEFAKPEEGIPTRSEHEYLHIAYLLLAAFQHNQDSGVNDWARLLMHGVFLNSIDELQQVQIASPSSASSNESGNEPPGCSVRRINIHLAPVCVHTEEEDDNFESTNLMEVQLD